MMIAIFPSSLEILISYFIGSYAMDRLLKIFLAQLRCSPFGTNHSHLKEKKSNALNWDMISSLKAKYCLLHFFKSVMKKAVESLPELLVLHWLEKYTCPVAECLQDEESMKETTALPFCNDTVTHAIKRLSCNMKTELILEKTILLLYKRVNLLILMNLLFCLCLLSAQ